MTSDKARTNKKWTSTDKYKENYDRIFGKKKDVVLEQTKELTETFKNMTPEEFTEEFSKCKVVSSENSSKVFPYNADKEI